MSKFNILLMSIRQLKNLYLDIRHKRSEKRYLQEISRGAKLKLLTRMQKKEIKEYYLKHLNNKVTTKYHEYYSSLNGIYSSQYIPHGIYYNKIIPALYDLKLTSTYDDKNFTSKLFPQVCQPNCIIKNINGYYYKDDKPISKKEALEICNDLPDVIIKPTLYTSGGHGVRKISVKDGISNGVYIEDIFDEYKKNFVVQNIVEQHEDLAKLNPSSLQTMRVVTYRRNDEVVLISALLRIGRKGAYVDNGTAGGFCCGIDLEGKLKKYGYTFNPTTKVSKTDNGIKLESYCVPHYKNVIELAKKLHWELPHLLMVGWDFTIDKYGKVILVELNPTFGINILQLTNGPAFGIYTEEIFKTVNEYYQKNR